MAINFPVSLDDFANVSTGDTITPAHKNDLNDAVEALMAKLGVDNSAVTTSHDYKFTHLPAQAGDWDAGAYEIRAAKFESDDVSAAPLSCASSALCTNLNADKVDGIDLPGALAQGDILYANTASSLSAINKDTTATRYLANTGTSNNPAWAQINLANGVTSALPVANGGTGASTAQSAINTLAGAVTANKVLQTNGTNVILSAVGLTSCVTGILPVANGGTNASTVASAVNVILPAQTGNANKFLESDGTNPTWQTINLATADVTGTLPVTKGGTGATAAANAANGVVVPTGAVNAANGAVILDASGKLPAVDGSQLTGISTLSQGNQTDTSTTYLAEATLATVTKTITSGSTVLMIASGKMNPYASASTTIRLYHGSTVAREITFTSGTVDYFFAMTAVVTGLSGSTSFYLKAEQNSSNNADANVDLVVLEF